MMPLARHLGLLLALSRLTSAATTSAEGQWVLWSEMSGAAPTLTTKLHEWLRGESFPTETACERELKDDLAKVAKPVSLPPPHRSEVAVRGNVVSLTFYEGSNLVSTQSLRLVCLPDNVDPRGPKGK